MCRRPGCFWMLRITPGLPFTPASPRLTCAPMVTRATSFSATGTPLRVVIDCLLEIRDARDVPEVADEILALAGDEVAAGGVQVGGADGALQRRSATGRTAAGGRPAPAPDTGPTPPPMAVTCATPGIDSSRGRSVQSASVAELERRASAAADEADQHDLPHQRGDRADRGHHALGQMAGGELQPFGDDLAIDVDVGVPVELDVEQREAGRARRSGPAARWWRRSPASRAAALPGSRLPPAPDRAPRRRS